jgi:hypothetical protein
MQACCANSRADALGKRHCYPSTQTFHGDLIGAGRGSRTPKGRSPADFESAASASSAIPALREIRDWHGRHRARLAFRARFVHIFPAASRSLGRRSRRRRRKQRGSNARFSSSRPSPVFPSALYCASLIFSNHGIADRALRLPYMFPPECRERVTGIKLPGREAATIDWKICRSSSVES